MQVVGSAESPPVQIETFDKLNGAQQFFVCVELPVPVPVIEDQYLTLPMWLVSADAVSSTYPHHLPLHHRHTTCIMQRPGQLVEGLGLAAVFDGRDE
ncbi:hypothetical protein D9M71_602750 [compost metagenome]